MAGGLERIIKDNAETAIENPEYLTTQLITCIGNKRSLLGFIGKGLELVKKRLNKDKMDSFDVFSGSGIVARYMKRYSRTIYVNDLEKYSSLINECYLTNKSDFNSSAFTDIYDEVVNELDNAALVPGFITQMYSPKDDCSIQENERVFYTSRNAKYLDTARRLIEQISKQYQKYLLAPLLSEASIHANTSGVFKGFYKNSDTGVGQFGGRNQDALDRITGDIRIPYPVFSNYDCDSVVFNGDSNLICEDVPEVDIAYIDPPYNQHPYGSNYFMLNLISEYKKPISISNVSGIPSDWKRSNYNRRNSAYNALQSLVEKIKAKYLLISFNSEGFIRLESMKKLLKKHGKISVLETQYNTFRGSRNFSANNTYIREYLYLLEKK